MPKIIVEIVWDAPREPFWLNADNVALALHAYCENTKFVVREPAIGKQPGQREVIGGERHETVI